MGVRAGCATHSLLASSWTTPVSTVAHLKAGTEVAQHAQVVRRAISVTAMCPADFKSLHFPPPPGAHKPGLADDVRRRRWVRRRRRLERQRFPVASAVHKAAVAVLHGPEKQRPQESNIIIKERRILGRAAPGEALPLPLGWSTPGRQLQLRPILRGAARRAADARREETGEEGQQPAGQAGLPAGEAAEEGDDELEALAMHDWSRGTSDGWHTVALDNLAEGATRLVCCSPLHSTREPGLAAGAGAQLAVPGSIGPTSVDVLGAAGWSRVLRFAFGPKAPGSRSCSTSPSTVSACLCTPSSQPWAPPAASWR
jgi:hypothetical protein